MGKLSYDDKIKLYEERKNGVSLKSLSIKYKITTKNAQYLCCLIDKHGVDILRTIKNESYPKGFNEEVISYNTSKSPNLEQINDMLNKAFDNHNNLDGLIFHSDQGWQYQHQSYQQRLKNNGIKQSMFRKENSMDNGLMENFFGLLKTEMFYDQEDNYKTLDDLIKAIDDYIYYYNYDRIKVKLKGLSPVNYRLQSSN